MAQLPPEAEGVAAAILIYSVLCLFCNLLMLWLLWTTQQTFSHIGVICMFTGVSIVVNIIQQIHDNLYWVDVMEARFEHIKANVGNPWLSASNGYTGLDFILWTIRYTTQTIAAGLACFWALSLAQAVYGWTKGNWTLINAAGKVISVLLPLIFINLCFWKPIYDSSLLFYIFFDFCFVVFIGTGAILLFIILVKYIRTGRELKEWDVGTGFGDLDQTSWRKLSFRFDDGTQVTQNVFAQTTGIYDRWLVIRFSIAFVFMILFVVNICVIQATGHADILHDSRAAAPDLSAFRAKRNLTLLMPGEIAGPLALVTFGTTKHFRDTLSRTFVPKRWRTPADADVAGQGTINGSICPSFASAAPMTAPMASKVGVGGGAGGGALGRRFGDRGSWTRGVRGLGSTPSVHCMPVPLQDLRSPMFRDSVWRESTLSSIPEYV